MRKLKIAFYILLSLAAVFATISLLAEGNIEVLNPKGIIAAQQRDLIATSTWLMLIIVIPTLILSAVIAWQYRQENKKAKHNPDWDYNFTAEAIWWGVPFIIITILSVIVWQSSYALDPFKPLKSDKKPLTIQAVALQWKWLFIYPEQKIATLNFVEMPTDVPIVFDITADAPMNSFWIPQLGGQIYAMPGMKTKLHLMANETGVFRGSSANLSGKGFSGMYFAVKAVTENDFDTWVANAQQSQQILDRQVYDDLARPSENVPEAQYALQSSDLYDQIVMKYMSMDGK